MGEGIHLALFNVIAQGRIREMCATRFSFYSIRMSLWSRTAVPRLLQVWFAVVTYQFLILLLILCVKETFWDGSTGDVRFLLRLKMADFWYTSDFWLANIFFPVYHLLGVGILQIRQIRDTIRTDLWYDLIGWLFQDRCGQIRDTIWLADFWLANIVFPLFDL